MRLVVLASVVVVGCYSPQRLESCAVSCNATTECPDGMICNGTVCTNGASCGDAPIPDVGPNAICAGTDQAPLGRICFDPSPPSKTVFDANLKINTDDDPNCNQLVIRGTPVCLINASITQGAIVTALGAHPLVLWSAETLMIDGRVDAHSDTTLGLVGAGANPDTCASGVPIDGRVVAAATPVGTGGAGGSFTASAASNKGGNGGSADGGTGASLAGGAPSATAATLAFHGGCPGGLGGISDTSSAGGNGGGAVYLVAEDGIMMPGSQILVGGGGGTGGATTAGGGAGGGSGGWIVLDATGKTIDGAGTVMVQFGGGGGGGARFDVAGVDGGSASQGPGQGGARVTGCTNKGGNAIPLEPGESTNVPSCGGGGGGGGAGLIQRFGI